MKQSTQLSRQLLQSNIRASISTTGVADSVALFKNPRELLRGFFYWGYFYFFTNTAPFQAAGSVMPG